MANYDFASMGSMAGVGQGLQDAGKASLENYTEIRRQDQMFQLGMQQVMVQMQRLQEEQRQADMIHKRFYRTLEAQDLSQIRDQKQRVALENLKNTFQIEKEDRLREFTTSFAETEFGRKQELANERNKTQRTVAWLQAEPARMRANMALAGEIDKRAFGEISNLLLIPDGQNAGEYMNDTQLEMHARDRGQSSEQYKRFAYDRFRQSVIDQYGKDAPVPNFDGFNSYIRSMQTGDVREYTKYVENLERQAIENVVKANVMETTGMTSVAGGGSDNVPLAFDHDKGVLNFSDTESGNLLDTWMKNVIADWRTGVGDNGTQNDVKAWRARANQAFMAISPNGVNLNGLDGPEKAVLDIVFNQESGLEGEDINLGLSNKNNNVLNNHKNNIFRDLKRGHSFDGSASTRTSAGNKGETTGQSRRFAKLTSGTDLFNVNTKATFVESINNGNYRAASRAYAEVHERFLRFDEPGNKSTSFIDDPRYAESRAATRKLLDDMLYDMSNLPKGAVDQSAVQMAQDNLEFNFDNFGVQRAMVPATEEGRPAVRVEREGRPAVPVTEEGKAEFLEGATTETTQIPDKIMDVVTALGDEASQRGQQNVFSKENLTEALEEAGATAKQIEIILSNFSNLE